MLKVGSHKANFNAPVRVYVYAYSYIYMLLLHTIGNV